MFFTEIFNFILKGGSAVRRNWGQGYEVQAVQALGKITRPFLVMVNHQTKDVIPWTPTQTDLFASDWEMVKAPAEAPAEKTPKPNIKKATDGEPVQK